MWLTSSIDTTSKLDIKTQQIPKLGAKTVSRPSQDTDSDENSDNDQRAPSMTPRERVRQEMASIGITTAKRNEENDEYVLQRLVNQGNKLLAEHTEALIMCHAGRDEMIPMQLIAAEIIWQSVDAEFHTIFDVPYTNSSTVDMQGTMYLRALVTRLWDLNTAAITTQQERIEEAITSYRMAEKDQFFDACRWATVVQAEQSAYEKSFELTSGTKDTMKTACDTSIRLLHVVGGFQVDHPTNSYRTDDRTY